MDKRGRQYCSVIKLAYMGGTLSSEELNAITLAMSERVVGRATDLSFTTSTRHHSVIKIRAIMRGTSPADIISELNTSLDQALMVTGLFEEFDVSGKVLWVAPIEMAGTICDSRGDIG